MPSASGSWTGWGWRVAVVTAANVNDAMMLQAMLDDVPSVLTPSGRRRTGPASSTAKAYDSAANRAYLRRRGIRPRIARRGVESSTRLGRQRWKAEWSLSWLSCWRRLGCAGMGTQSGGSRSCWWRARWSASTRTVRPYRGEASPGPGPAERTWVRFLLAADDRSGGVERYHPVDL